MKKNRLIVFMLLLTLVLALAACGGDDADRGNESGGTSDNPVEVVETEVTDAATSEPGEDMATTVPEATTAPAETPGAATNAEGSLLIWADEQKSTALEPLAAAFEEEYGVPVEIQQLQFGDIRDQLKIAGPAGEGPDIIVGAHDWLGELVVNGLVSPIDLGDKADLFVPNAIQAFTYNGELYGMPVQTENVALFRNTDIVADAPATWDDVMAACDAVKDEIEVCLALQQGDPYHFFGFMSSYGGRIFGETAEGGPDPEKVEIDSEGSLAAADALAAMVEGGYVRGGTDGDVSNGLFDEGKAAFIITGPWALTRLAEAGTPYAISAIPAGTEAGKPFLGVQGFMVSAFSEDALLAQTFLSEFVATDEVMTEMIAADPRPSAFASVRETQTDADLAGFAEAGAEAIPMPSIPEMANVWSSLTDALTLIQTGESAPDEAFKNAAEQIRAAIEGQ